MDEATRDEQELMTRIINALQDAGIPKNIDTGKALMILGGMIAGAVFKAKPIQDSFKSDDEAVESLTVLFGLTCMAGLLMRTEHPGWEKKLMAFGEKHLKGVTAFSKAVERYTEDDF